MTILRVDTGGLGPQSGEDDFEIDWVVGYNFRDIELSRAIEEYRTLIQDIENHRLQAQVRHGYGMSVLVLIRVPRNLLGNEVYKSRVKDWLHGIVHIRPVGDGKTVVQPETASEGLRSVFHLVTWTHEQGGAGVTAHHGSWEQVTAAFPPHDAAANRKLLRSMAGKTILREEDLDGIRALFGEKVAFYYAFIQCYSLFLIAPSICGVLYWMIWHPYSNTFAVLICLWGIVFVEYWKRQETDLALRWNVKGVGLLKVNRPQYKWDAEVQDPKTGEVKKVFPVHKRLMRQMLFLPFAALAGLALGTVLVVTFMMEAVISDVLGGQEKHWLLQFAPTILLSLSLPYITSALTSIATKLSEHENHRTNDEFDLAQVQKSFVLNFITSFLPILLTAYVYVPYGARIMPQIIPSAWQSAGQTQNFYVDPTRLQEEVISLSMTAQVMNFGEEILVPYLRKQFWETWRRYQTRTQLAALHQRSQSSYEDTLLVDAPYEAKLLARLRGESEAEPYDVQDDIIEMVVQFGYLTLFGVSWPLMPLGFLLNNWVELRSDFFKLSRESQRPPPIRSDSIGHSVAALEFLTWLGSLSSAALVYLYRGAAPVTNVRLSRLLLAVFIAEQAYLVVKVTVGFAFEKIGSAAVRDAEAERYMMRKKYLATFSEEAAGTSQRVRGRTFAESKRPSYGGSASPVEKQSSPVGAETPETPSIVVTPADAKFDAKTVADPHASQEIYSEYSTETAERFWTEKADVISTAEAGVKLIIGLKGMQGQSADAATTEDGDKPKWT